MVKLPEPVANYFTADTGGSSGGDAVARCFTEDGIVRDEGHSHVGREAIARWKAEASTKYSYTAEPIAVDEDDGKCVVTCRLEGNFPGSPLNLRYFFEIKGDWIASLETML